MSLEEIEFEAVAGQTKTATFTTKELDQINEVPTDFRLDFNANGVDNLILNIDSANGLDDFSALGWIIQDWNTADSITINGDAVANSITGTSVDDSINGDDGDDTLNGSLGNDSVDGGAGNDVIWQTNDGDTDTLLGGTGDDTLNLSGSTAGWLIPASGATGTSGGSSFTGSSFEAIIGSNFNDTIYENSGSPALGIIDTINAGGGDDLVVTNGSTSPSDNFDGGAGNDTLDFSAFTSGRALDLGAGTFSGHGSATNFENAIGGSGDDTIIGDGSSNDLNGGDGNDSLNGGTGNDTLDGAGGNDALLGSGGTDTLLGGEGDDTLLGGNGGDLLGGGTGTDRAQYLDAPTGVSADLQAPGTNTGFAAGDSYYSIEDLFGSNFDDTLAGDAASNHIWGADGGDALLGRNGLDSLYGMDGDDTLLGGGGGDLLIGGAGTDRAQYLDAPTGVTADLQSPGSNTGYATGDSYVSIEDLFGSNFDDNLRGNAVSNHIWGADGNDIIFGRNGVDSLYGMNDDDTLVGGGGGDVLIGGAGTDRAQYNDAPSGVVADLQTPGGNTGYAAGDSYVSIEDLYGSDYDDTLRGNAGPNAIWGADGNDVIVGRDGADTLYGGNDDDIIIGQAGLDILYGNAGNDTFVYQDTADSAAGAQRDQILDFVQGADIVNLLNIDANTTVAGNQAFNFIGYSVFHGVAGELHAFVSSGNSVVAGDVDGDSNADFSILVAGLTNLTGSDFFL